MRPKSFLSIFDDYGAHTIKIHNINNTIFSIECQNAQIMIKSFKQKEYVTIM